LDRRLVTDGRMQPFSVVPKVDECEDRCSCFDVVGKGAVHLQLGFQGLKKALRRGIIPAIALWAHALGYVIRRQQAGEFGASILDAAIRVEQQRIAWGALLPPLG